MMRPLRQRFDKCIFLALAFCCACFGQLGNTITKSDFNFGHQLGYQYARFEHAFFGHRGEWTLETGFVGQYTKRMPMVRNPDHQKRLMLLIPLYLEYMPGDNIVLQLDLTDLFIEVYEYRLTHDIHFMGGKSPRFRTKIRLLAERRIAPALALTLGVKFSSAKPYTIWDKKHNYQESNGLAGAGTGVADYLIMLIASKNLTESHAVHARIGLAPLGSPVEYRRGSGQADEIPYGLAWEMWPVPAVSAKLEVCGMYNGLSSTRLAHYSVIRGNLGFRTGRSQTTFDVECGLTQESDDVVIGVYEKIFFGPRKQSRADHPAPLVAR